MLSNLTDQIVQKIVETSYESLLALDSNLKVLFASPTYIDTFKQTHKRTVGNSIYELGNKQWDIPKLRELLKKTITQNTAFNHCEVQQDFPTIGNRIMRLNARQIQREVGKDPIILLAIVDTTEHKRLQEMLIASEERFRCLFETARDGILLLEKQELKIQYSNPAITSMLGYSNVECIGKNIHDVGFPNIFSVQQVMHELERDSIIHRKDLPIKKKTGQLVDTDVFFVDKANLVQCNVRDITERKRAEEEKANLEAQFYQAQKMESVGRLAGGVAHDYNNMLSVIIGYSELTLESVAPTDPIHGNLQEIYAAAGRAKEITRQLLAFARQEAIAPLVLDLNNTVEATLKMLRRLIGEDIDLVWLPGPALWPVKIDPSQLDQILANLCINARDAITGVGRVSVNTQNVTFDEAYGADHRGIVEGNFVILAVSDDGCGMDSEKQERIFEPFFTTKVAGKGTGLGLATVYGIVQQNKGFINVFSKPGKGTIFRIYLPRYDGKITDTIKVKTTPIPKGKGEWVLVVEDNDSLLKLTDNILKGLGYTVLTARTHDEAMVLADRHPHQIQLLLVDVVMPEMNGRELSNQIHVLLPNLKTLFMSGYTADIIGHHGVLEQDVKLIQKPFSITSLATTIRNVLDRASTKKND